MIKLEGTIPLDSFDIKDKKSCKIRLKNGRKFDDIAFLNRSTNEITRLLWTNVESYVEINLEYFSFNRLNKVERFDLIVYVDSKWRLLVYKGYKHAPSWLRYWNSIRTYEDTARELIPYIEKNGSVSLVYRKPLYVSIEKNLIFRGQLDSVKNTKDALEFDINIKFDFPRKIDNVIGVTLSYRGNDRNIDIFPKRQAIKRNNSLFHIQAKFEKKDILAKIYKDSYLLVIHVQKNNRHLLYRINEISSNFYLQMHSFKREVFALSSDKKFLIQVALNGNLWIHLRDIHEVDSPAVIKREEMALKLFNPNLRNGNILMFEKESMMAQDNAFALFKHLQTTDIASKVFYVINKDSPQYKLVEPWKKQVINQFSSSYFKHIIEDQMIVSSESLPHIYQYNFNFGNIIDILYKKNNFFLQHGVIGIRKLGSVFKFGPSGFDFINVSTKHEQHIVKKLLKYPNSRIRNLGLPRWDSLTNANLNRVILYFPSWREDLAYLNNEEFLQSNYFIEISNFLNDEKLHKYLKEFKYKLVVFLHPKMRNFTSNFDTFQNIQITDSSETRLNALIEISDMVISDYSSMVWDFAYQRKPIILFQFDQIDYEKKWSGFFDKTIWKFGPVVKTEEDLIHSIKEYLDGNLKIPDIFLNEYKLQLDHVSNISKNHEEFIKKILMKKSYDKINFRRSYLYIKTKYIYRYLRLILRMTKNYVRGTYHEK